jgi:hypothetical protein
MFAVKQAFLRRIPSRDPRLLDYCRVRTGTFSKVRFNLSLLVGKITIAELWCNQKAGLLPSGALSAAGGNGLWI